MRGTNNGVLALDGKGSDKMNEDYELELGRFEGSLVKKKFTLVKHFIKKKNSEAMRKLRLLALAVFSHP